MTNLNEKQQSNLDKFNVLVEGPKIDFLTITLALPGAALMSSKNSPETGYDEEALTELEEEFENGVTSNILSIKETEDYAMDAKSHPKTRSNNSINRYKVNVALTPPSGGWALLQVCPKDTKQIKTSFIRLECNPSMGEASIVWMLNTLFSDVFLFQIDPMLFFAYAKVTRVDICVEFVGLDTNDLVLIPPSKVKGKRQQYLSNSGSLETSYYNRHPKRRSDLYFYDRRQRQIDQGKEPIFGDLPHTRLEKRYDMKNSGGGLFALLTMNNPLKGIILYNLCRVAPYGFSEAEWAIIKEALKNLGIDEVRKLLSDEQRYALDDHLGNEGSEFWSPETLWKGWRDCVEKSGLLNYEGVPAFLYKKRK